MNRNFMQPQTPLVSSSLDDLLIPGVMVEVDPEVADTYGAFEESALSETEAWESNADAHDEGAGHE